MHSRRLDPAISEFIGIEASEHDLEESEVPDPVRVAAANLAATAYELGRQDERRERGSSRPVLPPHDAAPADDARDDNRPTWRPPRRANRI